MLARDQVERYSRQLVLPEVGIEGQIRLAAARVLVVGAGGLGTPALLYLAGAGVGTLGVVDHDIVELSNLHRQVIHDSAAVGIGKAESAAARLAALNPHVKVDVHDVRLDSSNARALVRDYDIVVDGSDNFPTRYLVNDACVLERKPLVFGAVSRFDGQVTVLVSDELKPQAANGPPIGPASRTPDEGARGDRPPCYRCLFPTPPAPGTVPNCAEAGVLGVLPAIVGGFMAAETLKLILGLGSPLAGRLLLVDLLEPATTPIVVERDPDCPVCGEKPSITELIDYEAFCGVVAQEAGSSVG
ncbi:MAG TPA: molybdopterin-synthase adenylyltransferase MoeB [Trueperaceae bacterium]|nr:molybdopterin-synthase adenylyltransferase MoeB [Trueperaceae bacterium]